MKELKKVCTEPILILGASCFSSFSSAVVVFVVVVVVVVVL